MVTFLLPAGPKNLETLFPGVNFSNVEEYQLFIKDQNSTDIIVTTPVYKRACCCNEDTIRLFFVNYLGGVDAVNFKIVTEETETVSTSWKKSNVYPLAKWDGGKQRFNVTSNELVIAETTCFQEEDQEWLKEMFATPNAWVQWSGKQSQDDDYIPVVIRDGKFLTRKIEGRYEYLVRIEFEYANENLILRT